MRTGRGVWGVVLVLVLAGWGCGPPEMVPVAPPGLEYQPVVEEDPDNAAQALGETPSTAHAEIGTTINQVPAAEATEVGQSRKLDNGLVYETLKPGTGAVAEAGKRIFVHYTGTLTDGTEFDSSRESNRPFQFVVGAGGVIKGWDVGIAGMKVGERRKLTIPPDLAYGANARPKIPANSTLVFDVELLRVEGN